jgi:CRP-like cAMP-binding protein
LKSAEQLGFVPVAYLPGFCERNTARSDVVKMVKLNGLYEQGPGDFTEQSARIVRIVDQDFEDQKMGLAIIRLLGTLAMFSGLGDGELRKISRLFTQKLFRPGQTIFSKGDSSNEAYIIVRGRVDIVLEVGVPPLASMEQGNIFGELAFLDGAPRSTGAVAAEPTILLVMERTAFFELVRREPALGLCVMRNIATDLAAKLRQTDATLSKFGQPGRQ